MTHNVYFSNIRTERIHKHWCSKREHIWSVCEHIPNKN